MALCEPRYFDIGNTINDWHRQYEGKRTVDRAKALRQFADLVSLFGSLGIEVMFVEPDPSCPYQVFTRDTCVVLNSGAVITVPSTPVRRPEAHETRRLLTRLGIPVVGEVEGEAGDVVFADSRTAVVARSRRTPTTALAETLARNSRGLQVRQVTHESSTHLDTIFAVIDSDTCVVTSYGMTESLRRMIEETFTTVIRFDARTLGTLANNFIVVGPRTLVASSASREQNRLLASHGITVHEVDLSEFNLSGAGPRCMTLEILREADGDCGRSNHPASEVVEETAASRT
ncbi:MAG TPA: arginine deiminase family protein [Pyrinomonadaceae bacterium]